MTRVLVIAQSDVMRIGLVACLTAPDLQPDLQVVGSSIQWHLTDQLATSQPDVLLLELGDEEDWGERFAAIHQNALAPAIVVVADDLLPAQLTELLRSEVKGILPKSVSAIELRLAILAAAVGLVTLHPSLVDAVLPVPSLSDETPIGTAQGLTLREVEVLRMLAEGMSNKQIARQLSISEHTVKFHVSSIFSKLSASSRTEAVRIGVRQGLIFL